MASRMLAYATSFANNGGGELAVCPQSCNSECCVLGQACRALYATRPFLAWALKAFWHWPIEIKMNGPAPKPSDCLECRAIAPEVVLLTARGRVTRSAMASLLPTFRGTLARMQCPGWIIDTSKLDDFEPGAVGLGNDWFREFKSAGGEKVVFVSGLATARMAAMTISFAARLPLVTCLTFAEACGRLGVVDPARVDAQAPRIDAQTPRPIQRLSRRAIG